MIIGVIVAAIGTGLLTQIGVGTPTVQWAAFLVLAGLGTGAGIQLPYTALQVVLRYVTISMNTVLNTFANVFQRR
jgi:hypothetical protein